MLEFWNDGFKETSIRKHLVGSPVFSSQYSNIPLFQYSMGLTKKKTAKSTVILTEA